ncbi:MULTISPECIES: hypothetical protein [Brucella]|nr:MULTISPECIES: hypothetical protein [Brucella]AIB32248.1 Hypothetical protein BSSP2_II0053 [Brucella suis bv. 2]QOK56270.1 hypothetical protein HUZ27_13415 [Brucella suis bv. 1]QOK59197.1 hypothetical protein HUZ28_13420 [Brucella suis bv. 1]
MTGWPFMMGRRRSVFCDIGSLDGWAHPLDEIRKASEQMDEAPMQSA